ncbi:YceI family protein [Kineosporiaceae bacterium SCSIO 59966]|jgi:polyisoprenoid-binding protein YceI|nr:YceI family protein [Kineosporiaceae bacterium SCSIO 59966]
MSETTTTQLPAGLTPGTYVVDPAHSEVGFTARHAMVTKVRGTFNDVQGTIVIGDDPADSSATATIQVASVDTRSADRDAHLRSADFFDVENYPEMTFRTTGVRPDGEDYLVDGELTIKGVTKPVTLKVEFTGVATDPFGNQRAGFSGETEVDREQWGLTWNAALETGGVLVSRKVRLAFDVSAIKQS